MTQQYLLKFETAWLDDEKQLTAYCWYIHHAHLLSVDSFDVLCNMATLAIINNNIKALKIIVHDGWFDRGDYPWLASLVGDAAEYGNLETFKLCLWYFMNCGEPDEMDYDSLMKNIKDNEVKELLIKLKVVFDEGILTSNYGDSLNIKDLIEDDEENAEWVKKIKLYRKIMNIEK